MISEVIQRAQAGDEAAFAELYRTHRRRVQFACLKVLCDADASEDLTQETFLRAFTKLKTFRGQSSFSTWIHRIAVNTALMEVRRRKEPMLPLMLENDDEEEMELSSNPVLASHDGRLEMAPERLAIERAFRSLSPADQISVELADMEGVSQKQIARVLECQIGAAKSRIARARQRMQYAYVRITRPRKGGAH